MWVIDQIREYIKEMIIDWIISSVDKIFGFFNQVITLSTGDAKASPMTWNTDIYSLVRNISDDVILPIAALIITFIMCYELIQMVNEKNNMHDMDTFNFFKYIFKAAIAVYLLSHTFDFVLAFFDVGALLVSKSLGIVNSTYTPLAMDFSAFKDSLKSLEIHELLTLLLVLGMFSIISTIIAVGVYILITIRMIEIYFYISLAPVPFATFGNKEWASVGINYTKVIFAYALQGVLIILAFGIYSQLVKTFLEGVGSGGLDFTANIFFLLGLSVVLLVSIIKSNSIAKSVLNAH